jgi:hypothetical protein
MSSKQANPQASNGQQKPAFGGSSPPPSTSIYEVPRAMSAKSDPISDPTLERANAKLLGLLKRARDMINVSPDAPPNEWPSTDEINQLVKDCDDILPNVRNHRCSPEASATNKKD